MKKLLLAAAFAAISLGGAAHSPAYAMNYKYRLVEDHAVPKVVVDASGEIMPNEVALFAAWGASLPPDVLKRPVAAFLFNSPGGNVAAAIMLAENIRKMPEHPDTAVVDGGVCASSCVILWELGTHKLVSASARVGVHQPDGVDLEGNLAGAAAIAQSYAAAGAPASVVAAEVTTPSTDVHWLTRDELIGWDVGIMPSIPRWEASALTTPIADAPRLGFRQAPGMGPVIDHPGAAKDPTASGLY